MTALLTAALPLAHAGESHWYDTIMFVTPMFVIAGVLCWTSRRERRAYEAEQALQDDCAADHLSSEGGKADSPEAPGQGTDWPSGETQRP